MRVISGSARGMRLLTLEGGDVVRPTTDRVKEALFSILQFELSGKKVLDLFAGSGQLGIEALSRGAKSAVLVDESSKAISVIRQNLKKTGFENAATVVNGDSLYYLRSANELFDIMLLDPPYDNGIAAMALPFAEQALSEDGTVVCETSAFEELPEKVGSLCKYRSYRYGKTVLTTYKKA